MGRKSGRQKQKHARRPVPRQILHAAHFSISALRENGMGLLQTHQTRARSVGAYLGLLRSGTCPSPSVSQSGGDACDEVEVPGSKCRARMQGAGIRRAAGVRHRNNRIRRKLRLCSGVFWLCRRSGGGRTAGSSRIAQDTGTPPSRPSRAAAQVAQEAFKSSDRRRPSYSTLAFISVITLLRGLGLAGLARSANHPQDPF